MIVYSPGSYLEYFQQELSWTECCLIVRGLNMDIQYHKKLSSLLSNKIPDQILG